MIYYGENNSYQRFLNPGLVIGGDLCSGYLGTVAFPTTVLRSSCEYEYLGAGATVGTGSENVFMNNATFCFTLNGGTNGALVLNKKIYYNANDTHVGEVIWTGDNKYPCEYVAAFSVGGARPVYWKKTGKGTWRFTTSTARGNAGVVATEQGCVEYDSIAEKGVASALGTSGWLLSEYYGSAIDESKAVPYAYLLGNETNTVDADTATMKYIGSVAKKVTMRPVALKGAGRFSSATAALDWTGFTSVQAGDSTLVLAGEAAGCVARSVTNGVGALSVVKEGAGDWTIRDDYDFSGGVVSQGGTLTLAGKNYTWYRLSLMQNYTAYDKGNTGTPLGQRKDCDGNRIWLSQFGLFDAAGSNLIVDLEHNTAANGNVAALQPGQAALGASDFVQMGSGEAYALTNLFNSAQTPFGGHRSAYPPVLDNEDSWVKVVVRLRADSVTPTRYDIRSYGKSGYDPFLVRDVRSWKIEGSQDGVVWDELDTVVSNEAHAVDAQYDWYSSDTPNFTTGYDIEAAPALLRPAALAYVSVSGGGTVVAEDSLTANGLKIDYTAGGGTIDGFAFAATSAVDLVNVPHGGARVVQLPVTFQNCSGLDELAGTLTVNGEDKDIGLLKLVDGKLHLYSVGTCIILR